MTSNPTPTTPADNPDPETTTEVEPPVTPDADEATAEGKRAVRQRAQEAEAERDALAAQLDVMRRQTIETRIPDAMPPQMYGRLTMFDPSDFWSLGGYSPNDLIGEAGGIDDAKLATALDELRAARPYLFGNETALAQALGRAEPTSHQVAASWHSELQKARAGTA